MAKLVGHAICTFMLVPPVLGSLTRSHTPLLLRTAQALDIGDAEFHVGRVEKLGGPMWINCSSQLRAHPDSVSCPLACPFLRMEPSRFCEFRCVVQDECNSDDPFSNFADRKTMRCSSCHVPACHRCSSSSKDVCAECHGNFYLSADGSRCVSRYRMLWWAVYSVLALALLSVVYYLVMLSLRKIKNPEALAQGLAFRAASKTREPASGQLYALSRNPASDDLVGRTVGISVMLNFNFQQWMLMWSMAVMAILLVLRLIFYKRQEAAKHRPSSSKAFHSCNSALHEQQEEIHYMEVVYFWVVLAIYLMSVVASVAFAVHQRRIHSRRSNKHMSMDKYALYATGFPAEPGSEKVEEDMQRFFEQRFKDGDVDVQVVGVSVCWNYWKLCQDVGKACRYELEDMDQKADLALPFQQRRTTCEARRSEFVAKQETGDRGSCCDPQLRCVDAAFGVGPAPCVAKTSEKVDERLFGCFSDEVSSSGSAFIVFGTERQCNRALEYAQGLEAASDALKYKDHEIKLEQKRVNPQTVLWDSFGASDNHFQFQICSGILWVLFAIIILDLCFYAPYVSYIISYSEVSGMTQGNLLHGLLLGLLITACNQIIFAIISCVSERCPFNFKVKQQQFYVILYTFAILINTIVDLCTVMYLAKGFTADQALKMQVATDTTISLKAMAENPAVQRSIYVQLVAYLFPGCLIAPFLLEPIFLCYVPYFLGVRFVRSRSEVSIQDAEDFLKCPPFDLSRYGDILINVMLCVCTLVFTYREVWLLFFYLAVSLTIIYCWDRIRLLRQSQKGFFGSLEMAITSHYLLAFPCAMLAAVLVFRCWSAQDGGFMDSDVLVRVEGVTWGRFMNRKTVAWTMGVAAVVHLMLHFAVLRWLVPRWSVDDSVLRWLDVPYSETAEVVAANWFNSNPMHVLRSCRLHQHDPPCIQCVCGKEYLQKANPAIGNFYELDQQDFKDELSKEHLLKQISYVDRAKSAGVRKLIEDTFFEGA